MLKIKYLHRSSRISHFDTCKKYKKYYNGKNLNLFDDLPYRGKMLTGWKNFDFTPLLEFIESKIGENWNDVYSEILTKIKKKFRHNLDDGIGGCRWNAWIIKNPIYDENFIPRDERGRILSDCLYIDFDNIVRKASEEDILILAKKYMRKRKIQEILESQQNEEEINQNSDIIF